jgi:hypothetical protein
MASASAALNARFEAAIEVLERGSWTEGMALLMGIISESSAAGNHRQEALARALLCQALVQTDQLPEAQAQAESAFRAAELSNHRDTIHRCMALRHTLRVLSGDVTL